jgi:exodeoxyribonuclease V beta subunit
MDILSRKTHILESRFLQASAGTGKTFAIEQLIARFILQGFRAQEILAVTFTRMAARDMRRRVRSTLERLLREPAAADYLQAFHEEGKGFEAQQYLKEALCCFDQAQIFTIHGFCQHILSQHAFEAGMGFQQEERSAQALLKEVVLMFLRTQMQDPQEIQELLKESRQNFETLNLQLIRAMSQPKSVSPFMRSLGEKCRVLWKEKCEALDLLTPDGLLEKMEKALERPAFADTVRAKYRVLIIDEFQDTDPLSWKIFSTLFLGKGTIVYLVGDPKQSIYGFRSADLATYLRAGEALGKEKHAHLSTNYRSRPQLVEALNSLFAGAHWLDIEEQPGTIHYVPVQAGRSSSRESEEAALCFFVAQSLPTKERTWPSKQMEELRLFPYIAKEAARLNQQRQIPWAKIAILVKDRFQAERLQNFLEAHALPSTIRQTLHLATTAGFQMLADLLYAVLHIEDRGARAKIERSCGKELPLHTLRQTLLEKGFPHFYHEVLKYNICADPSAHQTAEILLETCVAPSHLLCILEELKEASPEEDPRLKVRPDAAPDRIQILTIFASKGLEFDAVFALGLASRHLAEEGAEREEEKMRQLYVALTRAREKLYVPLVLPPEGHEGKTLSAVELFWQKRFGREITAESLKELPEVEVVEIQGDEIQDFCLSSETEQHIKQEIEPSLPSFPKKFLTSFSSLSQKNPPLLSLKEVPSTLLPLGTETGTLVHAILERVFQTSLHSCANLPALRSVVKGFLVGTSLDSWQGAVEEMILQALHTPLWDEFCLKDLRAGEVSAELEFLYPQGDMFVKGFIDLLFRYKGQYYVLDWKTNWTPSLEDVEVCMKEHDYFLQASLYLEAARRYVKQFDTAPVAGAVYLFLRGPYVYRCVS